jgi:hypothetical protein
MNEHIFDKNGSYYDGYDSDKYYNWTEEELDAAIEAEKQRLEKMNANIRTA